MEQTKNAIPEDPKSKIAVYHVFPGLQVYKAVYQTCGFTEKRKKCNKMEINFCISGRFESEFTKSDIGILKPGDMAVSMFDGKNGVNSYTKFPMGFYEGLSIMVDCDTATKWMRQSLGKFAVDMNLLKKHLLSDHWYRISEAGLRCEHVFREIYDGLDYEPQRLIQLKMTELFMLMENFPQIHKRNAYYPKNRMDLVKHIRDHIITDNSYYSSIEHLAKDHGLSAPQLQKLFRQVFGMPIYQYLKEYRLEQAAVDLVRTEASIMELAQNAGFTNASKFSESFKKRYGMTPTAYRKLSRIRD